MSTIGRVDEFVPRDFDVPRRLETRQFVLEPLGPEHNEQDYDAWTSSMDHIAATCSAMPTTSASGRGSRTRCSIRRTAT
jgi:hypothetical protein